MALTPDQQQYYDDLDEMMATPGWKRFVDEAKSKIYELQADALDIEPVPGITTDYRLGKIKGQAEQLAYLINLEEVSDMLRRQLEMEE